MESRCKELVREWPQDANGEWPEGSSCGQDAEPEATGQWQSKTAIQLLNYSLPRPRSAAARRSTPRGCTGAREGSSAKLWILANHEIARNQLSKCPYFFCLGLHGNLGCRVVG